MLISKMQLFSQRIYNIRSNEADLYITDILHSVFSSKGTLFCDLEKV